MLQMESRRGAQHVNGATVYVSANKYLQDGQFVFDQRAVSGLAGGDDAVVTWNVTVVKTSGGFNEGNASVPPPDTVNCGSPSQNMSIRLLIMAGTGG
jgi:hypothetical protein